MKEVIRNKLPIYTTNYVEKCKCGETVYMRKCFWLHEAEDLRNAFSRFGNLTSKHKARSFFLGICKCKQLFYLKK